MIRGVVTDDYEAVIHLTVVGQAERREPIEAVVDTGYNGWLSLPSSMIHDLELPWIDRSQALLADGSEITFDIYEAVVLWDRRRLSVPIDASESTPLVGMRLLEGFELSMKICRQGRVTLQRFTD